MAARKSDPIGGGEKQGTIEIAYVKLAGNDATLQKVVDAFTALINRPMTNGNALSSAKRVNALPAVTNANHNANGELPLVETNDDAPDSVDEDDSTTQSSSTGAARTPPKYNVPTAIPIDTESGVSVG